MNSSPSRLCDYAMQQCLQLNFHQWQIDSKIINCRNNTFLWMNFLMCAVVFSANGKNLIQTVIHDIVVDAEALASLVVCESKTLIGNRCIHTHICSSTITRMADSMQSIVSISVEKKRNLSRYWKYILYKWINRHSFHLNRKWTIRRLFCVFFIICNVWLCSVCLRFIHGMNWR